jgi:hypothetical protein
MEDHPEMLPAGFEWNQSELEPLHPLNDGLVSLLAFHSDRRPEPIGTGFIVFASPELAVACTAAHVLRYVHEIQNPIHWHHPSALREFLPEAEPIDLDRRRVRAIHLNARKEVEPAILGWAFWEKTFDVAFFSLIRQKEAVTKQFEVAYEIDDSEPEVGDVVVAMGYEWMEISNDFQKDSGHEGFQFGRRLLMRVGRVSGVYPEGLRLCKGPCVETTVPVFPGMSGGPMMRVGMAGEAMRPFGLISSDPSFGEPADKWNRSIRGSSVISLLGATTRLDALGQRETMLRLNEGFWAFNKDELTRLAENRPKQQS